MFTIQSLTPWIDLLWIPLSLVIIEKGRKIKTAFFAGACVLMLRLQIELMQSVGFPRGVFGLIDMGLLPRGQITYGLFIFFFLILSHFSPGVDKHVHIAASITIFITAFCVSTLVMIL